MNAGKTKVMCMVSDEQGSGRGLCSRVHPRDVCRKEVGSNSILSVVGLRIF